MVFGFGFWFQVEILLCDRLMQIGWRFCGLWFHFALSSCQHSVRFFQIIVLWFLIIVLYFAEVVVNCFSSVKHLHFVLHFVAQDGFEFGCRFVGCFYVILLKFKIFRNRSSLYVSSSVCQCDVSQSVGLSITKVLFEHIGV